MKIGKKILSFALALIMCFTIIPIMDLGLEANAAYTLNQIKAVYPEGSYFTSTGSSCGNSSCSQCLLANIPSRGGLPSGATASEGWSCYSCLAFANYVTYCLYGINYSSHKTSFTSVALSNAQPGDFVIQSGGSHYGIYMGQDSTNVYMYDSNWSWIAGGEGRNIVHTYSKHAKSSYTFAVYRYSGATPTGNNPIGSLDLCSGGAGVVNIGGWAFDPDNVNSQLEIHVYIGGPSGQGEGHNGIIANGERPDVHNVYGSGNYHGYSATISTNKRGSQPVYVYAINVGGGENALIGSGTATISDPTNTITFNYNGGYNSSTQSSASVSYTVTKNYSYYAEMAWLNPVRTGYTFKGWYTSTSGGTQVYGSNGWCVNGCGYWSNDCWVGNSNLTLYAQWSANGYTVTFNANGGSCSTSSKSVTYGSTYGTLPTPTRTGYTFNGWYTATSGGTRITSSSTVSITSNQTLYAQWSVNSYTLTYNLDGGSLQSGKTNPTSYTIEDGFILNNPTKFGYTFKGWKVDSYTVVGNKYVYTNTTSGNKYSGFKLQLYSAKWEYLFNIASGTTGKSGTYTHTADTGNYLLRFGANGSTADDCSYTKIYLEKGKTYNYSWLMDSYTDQEFIVRNLTFCESSGAKGPSRIITVGTTGSRTYTAVWEATPYTLTYNLDGGSLQSGKTNPTSYTIEDGFILNNPTKFGYTFKGWKVNSYTVVGNKYVYTNTTSGNKYSGFKLQLYSAKWEYLFNIASGTTGKSGTYTHSLDSGNYFLNFGANGSTADDCSYTKIYLERGKTYNYSWLMDSYTDQEFVVRNLTFCESSGAKGPSGIITVGTTGSRTYTANWEANTLSVHYVANGGTLNSDTYTLNGDVIHNKSDNSKYVHKWTYNTGDPTGLINNTTLGLSKTGYKFIGWGTSPDGGTIYDQDTFYLPTEINSNIKNGSCSITLYAIWEKIELVSDSDAVIDDENGLIFGINEGFENIEDFVSLSNDGAEIEFTPTANGNGTGSVVRIIADGTEILSYRLVIFGDYNGDGFADAEDTGYFASISNFELFDCYEEGNEHLLMAADINGDGVVDSMDEEDMNAIANFEAYIDPTIIIGSKVVRYI